MMNAAKETFDMDAGDLEIFTAVAESGGISKAALILNTVQSNVTQRIRLLEDELGVPLFHRHSRGVTLTGAGTRLVPYAERIGHLICEAKEALKDGPNPGGKIRIGALETATAVRLPPLLSIFAKSFPGVDIDIKTGTSAELTEKLLSYKLDAAFVAGPVDHPEVSTISLLKEELVLATAPEVKSFQELIDTVGPAPIKVVVFRSSCSYRTRFESLLATRGLINVRSMEFGTLDGIIGCVSAGIGITFLPRAVLAPYEAAGRIALHKLQGYQADVPTILIHRSDTFMTTALRSFIAAACNHFGAKKIKNIRRR